MNKLRFTPETFCLAPGSLIHRGEAAEIANAKLDSWLKDAVRVYGYEGKIAINWTVNDGSCIDFFHRLSPTHQALLINIEPIEKPKPCEHRPDLHINHRGISGEGDLLTTTCDKCGVRLKAEWREV